MVCTNISDPAMPTLIFSDSNHEHQFRPYCHLLTRSFNFSSFSKWYGDGTWRQFYLHSYALRTRTLLDSFNSIQPHLSQVERLQR